ncbi:MAG: hypothetical protein WKF57_01190 [Nakamurella sp.]
MEISRRRLITAAAALPLGVLAAGTLGIGIANAQAFGIGRQDVVDRARYRVGLNLAYHSDNAYTVDGYRMDCSGFTAWAWNAPKPGYGTSEIEAHGAFLIGWDDLLPGDAVNNRNPGAAGHIKIFSRWINDADHSAYEVMEHTGGGEFIRTSTRSADQANGFLPVRWGPVDILKPYGLIGQKWYAGNNQAIMGDSVNDEYSTNPYGSGRFRDFQNGMIVWKSGAASA